MRLLVVVVVATVAASAQAGTPDRASLASDYDRGTEVASALTQATGVMTAPLLGMAVVGARRWYAATPAERAQLPWHARPLVWGTFALVMVAMFLGHRIPLIRHGFRQLKVLENKASGLLALPLVSSALAEALAHPVGGAMVRLVDAVLPTAHAATGAGDASGFATVEYMGGYLAAALMGAAVWLVGHSVLVLTAMSPVPLADWVLKTVKAIPLAVLALASQLSTGLGATLAATYILFSLLVAGWAFRVMVFGWSFSTDLLLRRSRRVDLAAPPAGFAVGLTGVPRRSLGRLERTGDTLTFAYRPWLVLPLQRRQVPRTECVVVAGVISPVLARRMGEQREAVVRLCVRYRPHARALASLWMVPMEAAPATQGLAAAVAWIREQLGLDRSGAGVTLAGE